MTPIQFNNEYLCCEISINQRLGFEDLIDARVSLSANKSNMDIIHDFEASDGKVSPAVPTNAADEVFCFIAEQKAKLESEHRRVSWDSIYWFDRAKFEGKVRGAIAARMGDLYDFQTFGAVWLQNQGPTWGEFGPNEIHPNAQKVDVPMTIADVRWWNHPLGGGKMSQRWP